MRHIQKIFTMIVVFLMTFTLVGCNSEEPQPIINNYYYCTEKETVSPDSYNVVAINKQVIYHEDCVKVSVLSIDTLSEYGTEIRVLIENNSPKNILVNADYASMNDYMVDCELFCTVASGKRAFSTMTFSKSSIEEAGIDIIREIEFVLFINSADSLQILAMSDIIKLITFLE